MDKAKQYALFNADLKALLGREDAAISSLSNFCALYVKYFNPHWVGFYLFAKNELFLGPFQGPVACTKIEMGKGVCGKSFKEKVSIMVPNVHEFEGHIACSPHSKSEIVVPLLVDSNCVGVIDIDSTELDAFDEIDQKGIEKAAELICEISFQKGTPFDG